MDILSYILEEGLIIIPALYIIAEIIKRAEVVKDKYIPLILLVISVIGTPLTLIGGYTAQNVVQAILVAGATVFSNQIVKQSRSDE